MTRLGSLLSSAARTEILRALACQPGPVGVRQVAHLAGVHPHSAELALAALVREKRVRRTRTPARPVYEWNRTHPDAPVLEAVFAAAALGFIAARRPLWDKRAGSILPFIRRATRMLARARESRHVA